ncbi:MAG: hypothetical protein ABI432_11275 [Flavobacteriales bacterium]
MLRKSLILLLSVAMLAMPEGLFAQGCAMCKAVVQSGENGAHIFGGEQSIGRGLNMGILYLMAVPYLLLTLLLRKRIVAFFKEFASAQG